MNIGIIGSGNIGAMLARKLTAAGHNIKLANSRGPDSIMELAHEVGAKAVTSLEAVTLVDVIILSIPTNKFPGLQPLLRQVPDDVVIIDTSNYYPFRDGTIIEIEQGKTESVWVAEQIGRPVIKAWNVVLAATLAETNIPSDTAERIALPVAGDGSTAKSIALDLVRDTGFNAVDAGSIEGSWRQQPGTPAYCTELTTEELKTALKNANKLQAPIIRDALINEYMSAGSQLTHGHMVARNRTATA